MTFKDKIIQSGSGPLQAAGIEILQVNLGYKCNMTCKHCHVQAGPGRDEMMAENNVDALLDALTGTGIGCLDITGGAPELNPHFRRLVRKAREAGLTVIVRSNLTIYYEPGMEGLFDFYRDHGVEIIASLPHYREAVVDRVRGADVFRKSLSALLLLNSLGYGANGSSLRLNLVYNPQGAFLPPSQAALEEEYKKELSARYGVSFNSLYTFINMPIGRFKEFLDRSGNYEKYMEKLKNSFNAGTVCGLMCRRLINVGWDGMLYDCDFNQMAGLAVLPDYPRHIGEFDYSLLGERKIAVDDHCFGCTAGRGST